MPHAERSEQITLELSSEAYMEWLKFAGKVEKEPIPGGGFDGMNDWGGKLPGSVAHIAGLFHMASHKKAWEIKVEGRTMKLAADMGYF